MPDQRSTVFRTNPNKDFLRTEYDYAHVDRWYQQSGRRLRYLGLPAWQMLDITAWERFLERFTTIEREENQQHLMFLQANVRDGSGEGIVTYSGTRRTTHTAAPGERLWVYRRGGQECRRCGTTIQTRKQGEQARSTYWCPTCQPFPASPKC